MSNPTHWLIWDGACDLCRRSVAWVKSRDSHVVFRTVPYQDAPSPPMTPELYQRAKNAVQVICPDGQRHEAGAAVVYILRQIGYRRLARILGSHVLRPLTNWSYWRVSRNRRFFGAFLFRKIR